MLKIILLIIVSGIMFLAFLYYLFKAILKKKTNALFISVALFIITCFLAAATVSTITKKMFDPIKGALGSAKDAFGPRTGLRIYIALFDRPYHDCVTVLNKKDQVVPRLDCCIWLEFKTCPKELERIIAQQPYEFSKHSALDTNSYVPSYSPRPEWWTPHIFGDSVNIARVFSFDDPNHDKLLVFSKDSTHAFYCDMAD
jgi:hypothetical protein